MVSRADTTAETRRALLDAAAELLDAGGPAAVTLREVGSRAGVSRSAPYRHFQDKESLLRAVAVEAWIDVGSGLDALASERDAQPEQLLRTGLLSLSALGRARPHLYRLMFAKPSGDTEDEAAAVERVMDLFLGVVSRRVGAAHARRYAGLLFTGAHGITDLELSGHLEPGKWQASADELVELLISLLPPATEADR